MPIVSINLSPLAYEVYQRLSLSRKASSITSQMLLQWDRQEERTSPGETPSIQFGDIRRMSDGQYCAFTETGWKALGPESQDFNAWLLGQSVRKGQE